VLEFARFTMGSTATAHFNDVKPECILKDGDNSEYYVISILPAYVTHSAPGVSIQDGGYFTLSKFWLNCGRT
jgi:hypothetical protein